MDNSRHMRVFIGTYAEGIYACDFDPHTGAISEPVLAVATDSPSFLARNSDATLLVAVNERDHLHGKEPGAVSVFATEPSSSRLRLLRQVPSEGTLPAFISFDRNQRYILVANYGSGSAAVFAAASGGVLTRTSLVEHMGHGVNPERQERSHIHSIATTPDITKRMLRRVPITSALRRSSRAQGRCAWFQENR
jgi:6-phosphogluconolactonase